MVLGPMDQANPNSLRFTFYVLRVPSRGTEPAYYATTWWDKQKTGPTGWPNGQFVTPGLIGLPGSATWCAECFTRLSASWLWRSRLGQVARPPIRRGPSPPSAIAHLVSSRWSWWCWAWWAIH